MQLQWVTGADGCSSAPAPGYYDMGAAPFHCQMAFFLYSYLIYNQQHQIYRTKPQGARKYTETFKPDGLSTSNPPIHFAWKQLWETLLTHTPSSLVKRF